MRLLCVVRMIENVISCLNEQRTLKEESVSSLWLYVGIVSYCLALILCINVLEFESWELSEFPPFLVVCGSFTCCCGNTGVKQILNYESEQKVDPRQNSSLSALTTELPLLFMNMIRFF